MADVDKTKKEDPNYDANKNDALDADTKNDDETKDDGDDDGDGGLDDDDTTLKLISGGDKKKTFEVDSNSVKLSKFITTILEGDANAEEIEIRQVPAETLSHVIDYLKHHKGKEPDPLPCPVRSIHMNQICSDKWDATWIDKFDKKVIFEIILAANYMDIKSLLHLGCAKIATLIKQLDQKEINRIIEEEEKYRREHQNKKEDGKGDDEKKDHADDNKKKDDGKKVIDSKKDSKK